MQSVVWASGCGAFGCCSEPREGFTAGGGGGGRGGPGLQGTKPGRNGPSTAAARWEGGRRAPPRTAMESGVKKKYRLKKKIIFPFKSEKKKLTREERQENLHVRQPGKEWCYSPRSYCVRLRSRCAGSCRRVFLARQGRDRLRGGAGNAAGAGRALRRRRG